MEFKIEKGIVLDALTKVQGITGKKTSIPITSNVLISAKDSEVSIRATDLEMAFKATCAAEVVKGGSTAVPSRKLYEIVRAFPSKILAINETENKWIHIADKNIEYNIVGMEPDDFPAFPDIEGVDFFEIGVDALKNMINKTIHSVLGDEGRAQLSGVCFESIIKKEAKKEARQIRMVSTDGHRLSKIDWDVEEGKGELKLEKSVIIPKSGIVEVLKLLEKGETAKIGFKDSNFVVKKDNELLIIRLIDGEFPNYEMVIPKQGKSAMVVSKEDFLMMLRRMSILSSDKYPGVRFKITKGQLEATTTNPEIGESKEAIALSYKGQPLEVAFNPRYFTETLNSMESEEVTVRFKDEVNPCTMEGKGDPGFLSVIMPMRV
jgi:DNA polymerase-3 subunit beta